MDTLKQLFSVPLDKKPIRGSSGIVQDLQSFAKDIDSIVLWLDCDKEGEAIAYDVKDVLMANAEIP